jgi:dTDP-4-amino-4,6-dideoxygalactose transaminase
MFINGPKVQAFQASLEEYLGVNHVIPCANGTDALQVALMALQLEPGDEVIVPAFTYVATAEVIALLGLTPVMVDVDPDTFNLTAEIVQEAITPRTKAVVPVHLFGQCSDMEPILEVAKSNALFVVEDTAQAIGALYTFSDGRVVRAGTLGDIGTTSFYPSKNLGCYGDGGAIFTQSPGLASRIQMVANHGQNRRYYHDIVGVNSRLDAIQAAILEVKLQYLDMYCDKRREAAAYYDQAFQGIEGLEVPGRQHNSTHVFHQYTIRVRNGMRDALQAHLQSLGIPSVIFYPLPLYRQGAFSDHVTPGFELPVTEDLCATVLSLPIHTELDEETLEKISGAVVSFLKDS